MEELKTAYSNKELDAIDKSMEQLNTVFQAASQEMYQAQQDAQGSAEANGSSSNGAEPKGEEEVTDVDFEEVSEEDSKSGK